MKGRVAWWSSSHGRNLNSRQVRVVGLSSRVGDGIATFCGFVQTIDEEGHVLVVCNVVGFLAQEASDALCLELLLVNQVGNLMERSRY